MKAQVRHPVLKAKRGGLPGTHLVAASSPTLVAIPRHLILRCWAALGLRDQLQHSPGAQVLPSGA